MPMEKNKQKTGNMKNGRRRRFLLYFLLMSFSLSGLGLFVLYRQYKGIETRMILTEKLQLDSAPPLIRSHFTEVAHETILLGEFLSTHYCPEEGGSSSSEVEGMLMKMAEIAGNYDQIRYIDRNGWERIRINYNNGSVSVVPGDQLQNKGDRYYFRGALPLREGELYVSPLDLNIEHGEVELPYKPMIRFSAPVFDGNSELSGIVVINYLAERLFDFVNLEVISNDYIDVCMTDPKGYYLVNTRDPSREFGFMFEEGGDYTIGQDQEDLWEMMGKSADGTVVIDHNLYAFTHFHPLDMKWVTSKWGDDGSEVSLLPAVGYIWYLVARIDREQVWLQLKNQARPLSFAYFFLLLTSLGVSYFLAKYKSAAIAQQQTIKNMAFNDELTGLRSRVFGLEHLKYDIVKSREKSERFAVIYADADKFKPVNDTYGHEAGDFVLKTLGERFKSSIRPDDMVIRMGGDEFVVVLENVRGEAEIRVVADRIIGNIRMPIIYEGHEINLGISLGVAFFPDDGNTVEELIGRSDEAMYRAKQSKRGYCFYREGDQ